MQKENKTQEQLELDNYRATGEVAYDESDEDFMDFSKTDEPVENKKTSSALSSLLKTFNPNQERDENGRWTDEGGGNKYEIPSSVGIKVKFHTPMGNEDPDQEYELKAIYPAWTQKYKDGTSTTYPSEAEIVALNTGLAFAPLMTVKISDLVEVK